MLLKQIKGARRLSPVTKGIAVEKRTKKNSSKGLALLRALSVFLREN